MTDPIYDFPFDPSGLLLSNKIEDERQVISPPNWSDFYFLIPLAGPYFRESLTVIHHPSGQLLSEGVDYSCTHRFHDASLAVGKAIYGSITFFDKTLAGVIELNYQTIGGAWTLNGPAILEILSNKLINPRTTTWEQVADLPFEFPTIDHEWDLVDMVGASALEAAILAIRDAVIASGDGSIAAHVADTANPHLTTKLQVGLGNVENYGISTLEQAQGGALNNVYMTPLRTAQAISHFVLAPLNAHIDDTANPHGVTKTQVGLGSVQNFALATQGEAEEGVSNVKYMTPLRTAQAIAALVTGPISDHLIATDNPHSVTKAQVGLGSVQNYGVADTLAAVAGTATNLYMTPANVRSAIEAQGDGFSTHIANTNNPHAVTAAQVGTLTTSAINALVNGRLASGATAVDSTRLGGLELADVVGQSKIRYTYPAVNAPSGITWNSIGTFTRPGVLSTTEPLRDAVLYVVGGNARGSTEAPVYLVRISINPITNTLPPVVRVTQLEGSYTGMEFGVVVTETVPGTPDAIFTLFVKNPPLRNGFSVTVLSEPSATNTFLTVAGPILSSEPDLYYAATMTYAADSSLSELAPGELYFGRSLPMNQVALPLSGQSVEFINVIDGTDSGEVTAVEALTDLPANLIGDYLRLSAYGSTNRNFRVPSAGDWVIDNGTDEVQNGVTGGTSLESLVAPNYLTDYTFEVDVRSTDAGAGAIGVCAAFVRKGGKDYGIYALRTPGQLVLDSEADSLPGGDIYKLFSVGINLLQDDAVDLGSTSALLNWGDGEVDEDRITAGPYVAAGNGWDVNGVCRIRVTRVGNTLTIETSQLDDTVLASGATVVIDLSTLEGYEFFTGPTSYGLATARQNGPAYLWNLYPDKHPSYIGLNGTDTTINRFDGGAWQVEDMNLDSPFIKPGRIYCSTYNDSVYFARRDGTLRAMIPPAP